MKKTIVFLLAALLCTVLLVSCNDAPPAETDPVDPGTNLTDSHVPTETTAAPAPEGTVIEPNGDFELVYGDPVPLVYGAVGDQAWGHYQFPGLYRNLDGNIVSTWGYNGDTWAYEAPPENMITQRISEDGGQTWRLPKDDRELVNATNLMPNGNYFVGFITKGAHDATWQDEYEPAKAWDGYELFFHEDMPINEDTVVLAEEYDPATGKTHTFYVTVNWKYAPLLQVPGHQVYPYQMMFALNNRTIQTIDGEMYMAVYFRGFDSLAYSKEEAVHDFCGKYAVYILKSADSGRTWNFVSQVLTTADVRDSDHGLCEAEFTKMPDGSYIMLMRTGSNNPSYMVRSASKMQSWTSAIRFDDIGVMPQLVTLDCGVTIATYGRPYMRVRATSDPRGLRWKDAETFKLTGGNGTSCYYTDLLPLDEDTALWIYSDFQYPNEKGEPVKSVIVRTITVVPKSAEME